MLSKEEEEQIKREKAEKLKAVKAQYSRVRKSSKRRVFSAKDEVSMAGTESMVSGLESTERSRRGGPGITAEGLARLD